MATLYLTEQGSMIRKTSDRLVVMKKREVLAEIPCAKLETIFLYGAVQVSTQALAELRGVEGSAAARHFSVLTGLVPPEIGFTGRNRRPPRDPMNALLSFGYVLVGNELQSLLDGMGFDPYIGFFHQLDYGRPSLALDLLEELRAPLIDRFSLTLLKLRKLTSADFEQTPEKGCLLKREPLRRYFAAYEEELGRQITVEGEDLTFRKVFRRQAERLARSFTTGEPYRSFRWPT